MSESSHGQPPIGDPQQFSEEEEYELRLQHIIDEQYFPLSQTTALKEEYSHAIATRDKAKIQTLRFQIEELENKLRTCIVNDRELDVSFSFYPEERTDFPSAGVEMREGVQDSDVPRNFGIRRNWAYRIRNSLMYTRTVEVPGPLNSRQSSQRPGKTVPQMRSTGEGKSAPSSLLSSFSSARPYGRTTTTEGSEHYSLRSTPRKNHDRGTTRMSLESYSGATDFTQVDDRTREGPKQHPEALIHARSDRKSDSSFPQSRRRQSK
eukprot:Clim_evm61s88 gene=Clim_evmTU61s88